MNVQLRAGPTIPGIEKPISVLALGTAFYRLDEKERWFSLLDEFLRLGGTLIDSGRIYGDSEAVLGKWFERRGYRDRVVLITKCGHGDGRLPGENIEVTVADELDRSLECLRTDYIDLYMLHRDNPSVPVGRIVDCLNATLDNGRVRALGASNWDHMRVVAANEYARSHGLEGFVAVSNNLSLAMPAEPFFKGLVSAGDAAQRWHAETRTPLIAWSSQARGFFTGRYSPEMLNMTDTTEDSFLRRMVEVYGTDENFERLRRAQELAREKDGCSAVQVALAWLLHKPFPVIPIVGVHTEEELASCAAATLLELSESELKRLNLVR